MKRMCTVVGLLSLLFGCSTDNDRVNQRIDADIQHAKTTICHAAYLMSQEIDAAFRTVPLLNDFVGDVPFFLTVSGWGPTFESRGSGKPGARGHISQRIRIGEKPSIPHVTADDITRLRSLLDRATDPRRLFNTLHTQERNGRTVHVTGNLMRKDTPRWYVWRNIAVTNHGSGGISVTIEMSIEYE